MKRLALLLLVLLLAGCGAGERWGGYTEKEAKEIMVDPEVKSTIIQATPRKEDQQPVVAIYPDADKLDKDGLRKVKMQGEDAWEYNDVANDFCLYVWYDKTTNGFLAQASHCVGVPQ
ncbi:MAG: hypothetical protein ABI717_04060 [Actinomycetota bacterium]